MIDEFTDSGYGVLRTGHRLHLQWYRAFHLQIDHFLNRNDFVAIEIARRGNIFTNGLLSVKSTVVNCQDLAGNASAARSLRALFNLRVNFFLDSHGSRLLLQIFLSVN